MSNMKLRVGPQESVSASPAAGPSPPGGAHWLTPSGRGLCPCRGAEPQVVPSLDPTSTAHWLRRLFPAHHPNTLTCTCHHFIHKDLHRFCRKRL